MLFYIPFSLQIFEFETLRSIICLTSGCISRRVTADRHVPLTLLTQCLAYSTKVLHELLAATQSIREARGATANHMSTFYSNRLHLLAS